MKWVAPNNNNVSPDLSLILGLIGSINNNTLTAKRRDKLPESSSTYSNNMLPPAIDLKCFPNPHLNPFHPHFYLSTVNHFDLKPISATLISGQRSWCKKYPATNSRAKNPLIAIFSINLDIIWKIYSSIENLTLCHNNFFGNLTPLAIYYLLSSDFTEQFEHTAYSIQMLNLWSNYW